MRREDHFLRATDLGLSGLLRVFALLSVALLLALAIVPVRSHFTPWRAQQERFNALAAQRGLAPVEVSLQQIYKPALGVVDRCTSCHLGMGRAQPIPGERLFAAHPRLPHEPSELGCTVCHGGQGRGTREDAAHGAVAFWNEPLLARGDFEAGCGTCHSHLRLPKASLAARGSALFGARGCAGCHGAEGAKGPDLAWVGLSGVRPGWHADHLAQLAPFTPLGDEELPAVEAFLATRVGAPRLLEAKALFHRLGCRGCHPIHGVGGDDGPELTNAGLKPVMDLDYSGVRGPHTLAGWHREHLLDPARVVRGSLMPRMDLTPAQAELLTVYVLSLRQRPLPEGHSPKDRVRALRLGERDFPTDGESLFAAFCAGCHGPQGEGRLYGGFEARFPAIGSADFLALADDAFLRQTILAGRAGRRMPAFGEKAGGLRSSEIDALVSHLRSLQPSAPSFEEVAKQPVDLAAGRALYEQDCAPCHGLRGEGSALAPPHAAADNALTKDDRRIHQRLTSGVPRTAMGAFRTYDAAQLRSVIAAVRALPPTAARRAEWRPGSGDVAEGKRLFADSCAGCHGARGEGRVGPRLGSPEVLSLATDGFLAATIVRGRGQAMPAFGRPHVAQRQLAPEEVASVVAFLRSLSPAGIARAAPGERHGR